MDEEYTKNGNQRGKKGFFNINSMFLTTPSKKSSKNHRKKGKWLKGKDLTYSKK